MADNTIYIERDVDKCLSAWAGQSTRRDVLLVRGARQVGKSSAVRHLGEQFENFVEVNFEETPELKNIFEGSRDPLRIIERLSAYFGKKIEAGKTLLFLDEIQECENALHALRFFKEKLGALHVIAAGSLLEFTLSEISSFGVGRITSLYLYPLNFGEFIQATRSVELRKLVHNAKHQNNLDAATRQLLFDSYRVYLSIGGLPEVVSIYSKDKDLSRCGTKLSSLVTGYKTDFAKYSGKVSVDRIRETFSSVAKQAGSKFVYANISDSGGAKEYKDALNALVLAGLCYKVFHSSCSGTPLGAEKNLRKFKLVPFDIGIFQSLNHLNLSEHTVALEEELINKGAAAELFVGLELVSYSSPYVQPELYYWHREAKSSSAEVDYVVELNNQIIPIEVKSSGKGAMKSMHMFLNSKNPEYGLRISHEDFDFYDNIKVMPIVALEQLRSLLS